MSSLLLGGSGKWIGPKKYQMLSDEQKTNWNPAWKEYREEKYMEMQYCEECGHELGEEEQIRRIPIGEPYRYYEAGALQKYFAKRMLQQSQNPIMGNQLNTGKTISFTRYTPLDGDEP